jgi:hypothetical protein
LVRLIVEANDKGMVSVLSAKTLVPSDQRVEKNVFLEEGFNFFQIKFFIKFKVFKEVWRSH